MIIYKTVVLTFNFITMTLVVYSLTRDGKNIKEAIGFAVWSLLNAIAIIF